MPASCLESAHARCPARPDRLGQRSRTAVRRAADRRLHRGRRLPVRVLGGHGDGRSYFVVEKDLQNNRLIVAQGEDHPLLYSRAARIEQLTWIDEPAKTQQKYGVKTRYRQPDQRATLREMDENGAIVEFAEAQRAVTPGQSLVIYQGDVCLGGGIIAEYYH